MQNSLSIWFPLGSRLFHCLWSWALHVSVTLLYYFIVKFKAILFCCGPCSGNVGLEFDLESGFKYASGLTSYVEVNSILMNRRSFHKEARGGTARQEGYNAAGQQHVGIDMLIKHPYQGILMMMMMIVTEIIMIQEKLQAACHLPWNKYSSYQSKLRAYCKTMIWRMGSPFGGAWVAQIEWESRRADNYCPWRIHTSWTHKNDAFMVRIYVAEHRCDRPLKTDKSQVNGLPIIS